MCWGLKQRQLGRQACPGSLAADRQEPLPREAIPVAKASMFNDTLLSCEYELRSAQGFAMQNRRDQLKGQSSGGIMP
jgi:hypothetical protein